MPGFKLSGFGDYAELTEEQYGRCLFLNIIIRASEVKPGMYFIVVPDKYAPSGYTANAALKDLDQDGSDYNRMYFDTPNEAIGWWLANKGVS